MPIILLLFFAAISGSAQVSSISLNSMDPPETKLFYSQPSPKAGDTLYLNITIPQGWHINSNVVLDDFLIPSSIETLAEGIEFDSTIWPTPFELYNEVLNINLHLLQDSFTVSLPIKSVSKNIDPYDVKLKFTYQACANICLAPKTIEVSFYQEKKKSDLGSSKKNSIFLYLLLAFLGGLLLNFMPCVLPVLFLKIFDLIRKSKESARDTLKWGIATTCGVSCTFFAIAAAILIIRLTGHAVGWGFQFQYPVYTATMALSLAVFALSLWGVFDIWMPGNVLSVWEKRAKASGSRGAFAYGILLVLLSTPCSAPFLGTAVGFAFAASTIDLFLIFAAVAIGMSSPYLILSIFPQWTRILPKPGLWMLILKRLLGFPLLLTVIWLVWIFSKQAGSEATFGLGLLLSSATFFAWLSGLLAKPGKPWWRFVVLWFVFIAMYAVLWNQWLGPKVREASLTPAVEEDNGEWLPFSNARLDSLQNYGYAVWVNGTADWCITCKVNDKNAFESEKVKKAFEEIPVIKMRADYTKPNYEILRFIESYGRSGVPFDLLLTSHKEAILLPELLTADAVIEVLERAY